MKIFVFDTESTGLIDKKNTNINAQPRIVQFAWILWILEDNKFKEEKRVNILINPQIPIPYNASKIHHIYDIDVKEAFYIKDTIKEIINYINSPDLIIWHNIEYDEEMVKLELKRLKKEFEYKPKQVICTMKQTVDFCAIKWTWKRFKYAKLWELHKKLFWEYFVWAHDAMNDVEATLRCFLELKKRWLIKIEKNRQDIMTLF